MIRVAKYLSALTFGAAAYLHTGSWMIGVLIAEGVFFALLALIRQETEP